MAAEDASKGVLSLVEYARKQRQADCSICRLPADVRQQMLGAGDRKIRRAVVIAWLKEVHGVTVTDGELTQHYSGKHDS